MLFAYRNSIHSSSNETPYYLLHGRDANIPINEFLGAVPKTNISPSVCVGNLVNNLRYTFQRVKEENKKARARQKEQYDKRAKENRVIIGDKVLLDIVVVKTGESKKFTSKYKGAFRVIKSYDNMTVDIADNSYNIQRVHVNRFKPFETMLWKDKKSPSFESTVVGEPHYKSMGTQVAEKEGGEEKGKEKEKDVNNSSDSDEWESFTSES